MSQETENRYHVQGKMNGRGRRWKNYAFSHLRNVAMDGRDYYAKTYDESEFKWRVWDTENDCEVLGRHYDYNDILGMRESDGERALVIIDLQVGDTAYHPGSTKRVLYGPLRVSYWISATGWNYQTEKLYYLTDGDEVVYNGQSWLVEGNQDENDEVTIVRDDERLTVHVHDVSYVDPLEN